MREGLSELDTGELSFRFTSKMSWARKFSWKRVLFPKAPERDKQLFNHSCIPSILLGHILFNSFHLPFTSVTHCRLFLLQSPAKNNQFSWHYIIFLTYHVNIDSCQIAGCFQVFFGPAILIVGQAGITALQVELNGQVPVCVVGEELLTFMHYRKEGRTSSWDTIYIYLYTFFYIYIFSILYCHISPADNAKWLYNALHIYRCKIIMIIIDTVWGCTAREQTYCLYG